MTSQTLQYSTRQAWDDQIAHTTEMFFEADRLEAAAYNIIESYSDDTATWARFSQAKQIADRQRAAAHQEWMRIQQAMRN